MTREEITAIKKRREGRENLFAYDCEYNHDELDWDLGALLDEVERQGRYITKVAEVLGCAENIVIVQADAVRAEVDRLRKALDEAHDRAMRLSFLNEPQH